MEYLINMSLTGSAMWLIYLLIKLFAKDKLCDKYKYVILKCVLLYYLIPIPFMKELYRFIWEDITDMKGVPQRNVQYTEDYRVLFVDHRMYLSQLLRIQLIIGGIWAVIALGILAYKIRKYLMQRRILLRCRKQETMNPFLEEEIKSIKAEINLKSNIVYIDSTPADIKGNTAFTLGIWNPIVLYPAERNPYEIRFILEHELRHIKNRDTLWRLLLDIAGIIHFYNPLEWFFAAEFDIVSEMACDTEVVQNKAEQQKKDYAGLLIQMAQEYPQSVVWSAGISKKKKRVQERVEHIMKREKKYFGETVSMLLICMALFLSSFTAFAYDDVKVWRSDDLENPDSFFEADMLFLSDEEEGSEISFYQDMQEFMNINILYDMQFIDEEGHIYEIKNTEISTKLVCSHQYVNGTVTKHVTNGTGGCTTTYYSAQRCSKCGNVIMGEIIRTVTNTVCPH